MPEAQFTQWLLEAQTPSIRYLTQRDYLGLTDTDSGLQASWESMATSGPIPVILANQTERGAWAGEHSYYTPKYTSTHWSMLLLAELAADSTQPGLQRGAEFMLADTRDGSLGWIQESDHGLDCFWGNLLRYELHCGMQDDPRLEDVVAGLVFDATQAEWRCRYNDERPCAWGAARALWGLAALPDQQRTAAVEAAIRSGLEFLLEEYDLRSANYPVPEDGEVHRMWPRLNFPLFYLADILFVLRVLAELGQLDHPGAAGALEWLSERRPSNGHWRSASPYRGRTWKALGDRHESDRWVSLQAALILRE
jgi:hypothetical protein